MSGGAIFVTTAATEVVAGAAHHDAGLDDGANEHERGDVIVCAGRLLAHTAIVRQLARLGDNTTNELLQPEAVIERNTVDLLSAASGVERRA